jgi:hypothetical protein
MASAELHRGDSLQPPSAIAGKLRRLRLDQRLAQVEGQAGAEQHQRDAGGDVVDARQRAQQAVQQGQQRAAPGGQHAQPGRAAEVASRRRRPSPRAPARLPGPRLMRPDFSVRHSPRLTNRKGVPTRMAPPSMASGTSNQAIAASCLLALARHAPAASRAAEAGLGASPSGRAAPRWPGSARRRSPAAPAPRRRAGPGGAAAGCRGAEAAEQDGHRHDGQRVVRAMKDTRMPV